MKLLIITRKIDEHDSRAGFFHRWVEEFSKVTEVTKLTVLCLNKGKYNLPKNITVRSMGKEKGYCKPRLVIKFFKEIIALEDEYDTVFVHMAPLWSVLGSLPFKLSGKKVYLWYTHRAKSLMLRLASLFVKAIFTASKESFSLRHTSKVHIVGHGIDSNLFTANGSKRDNKILVVGRLTRIKNIETILNSVALARKKISNLKVEFVGDFVTPDDDIYKKEIDKLVKTLDAKSWSYFTPGVNQETLVKKYCSSKLSINACPTGGLDKVVLESILCHTPVIVSNTAFKNVFGDYFKSRTAISGDAQELSQLIIKSLLDYSNELSEVKKIATVVKKKFSLTILIKKLVRLMS